jgi:hypothetical protein
MRTQTAMLGFIAPPPGHFIHTMDRIGVRPLTYLGLRARFAIDIPSTAKRSP